MSQAPAPDPSWKGLPSWLFFAFLVVGPPTALVAFTRTITKNPLEIVLLIAGYEVLVFLLRFTSKVWEKLEESVVNYSARWIAGRSQAYLSRYQRKYYDYLVYEHQVFDVKGLSTRTAHDLELEQVFVDLRIDSTPAHRASINPVYIPQELAGKRSIWEYLSSPKLSNPHLVVLGAPGSGKTTLLKHLALTLAQPKKYPRRPQLRHRFPLLLFLRDHVNAITDQPDNFTLAHALQNHMQRKWQQSISFEWIEHHLRKGKCLVLLDGLDEVADTAARQRVVTWVQRQLQAYGYRGHNRFILTSRPYGYQDNPLEGVTTLDVQPFAPEQVEQFIHNWYLANELRSWGQENPGVHLRAREGAQDLLRRLHRVPALLALAVNPLLLTMIATVHRYRSSLPGKRVALYAEICEVFLGKRSEARGIAQELSPAQKQRVLQPLAYFMMQQGKREIPTKDAEQVIARPLARVNTQMQPADFLSLIQNTSGLLLERNPGSYAFAHLTFQEYLTAVHIKEEGLEQELTGQVGNVWYHETIRLYCAQADATNLIIACLQGDPPSVATLTLAFECDEEKLEIQPHAQAQLNSILDTGREDPDPERRRIIAEAFLTRRLRQMVHLSRGIYASTSLLTCAEYQLFLDEQQKFGKWYQPDHWQKPSFPAGEGHLPILGVRQSDARAFCEWLTQRDTERWLYRLPKTKDNIENQEEIMNRIDEQTGYWTSEIGVLRWAKGKAPYSLGELIRRLTSLALDLDIDLARALALARARARARDLARDLDLDLDIDIDRARDLALALDLDRARDLARDLARARARDLDLDLDLALASASDRDLASDLALASNLVRDRDLARALASASAHANALANALAHVRALASDLDLALDLALTLYLLTKRRKGSFPAYEGILLVKEKKENLSSAETNTVTEI